MSELRASRSLLFPGELEPLSHFGATLVRRVILTALRYSLYQLGMPVPDHPPVVLVRLRPYLDAKKITQLLGGDGFGSEIGAALLEPAGSAGSGAASGTVTGAVFFHRLRLKVLARRGERAASPARPEGRWQALQNRLSRWTPAINDAFLGELLTVLDRRKRRQRGEDVPPASSREAWRYLNKKRPRLERLGPPDPYAPSWAERPPPPRVRGRAPESPPDGWRGSFRETYRACLSSLTPIYRELALSAVEAGVLDEPEDAFFVPFDLAADLDRGRRPGWLDQAVSSNRREYESVGADPLAPPERLYRGQETPTTLGGRASRCPAALAPLA